MHSSEVKLNNGLAPSDIPPDTKNTIRGSINLKFAKKNFVLQLQFFFNHGVGCPNMDVLWAWRYPSILVDARNSRKTVVDGRSYNFHHTELTISSNWRIFYGAFKFGGWLNHERSFILKNVKQFLHTGHVATGTWKINQPPLK